MGCQINELVDVESGRCDARGKMAGRGGVEGGGRGGAGG